MDPQQELTELRVRVAQLESMVERLSAGSGTPGRSAARGAATTESVAVGRRRVLRNGLGLSAAAVAGVGLVDAMGSSAAADTKDPVLVGQSVAADSYDDPPTRIFNADDDMTSRLLFLVDNTNPSGAYMTDIPSDRAIAIAGRSGGASPGGSSHQVGVFGTADSGAGVWGETADGLHGGAGVLGRSTGFGPGVYGTAAKDYGVWGDVDLTNGLGVMGTNTTGPAVGGWSDSGAGVIGHSTSGDGVTGVATSSGTGVVAASSSGYGITAESDTGVALKADASSAVAVQATSSTASGVTGTSDTAAGVAGVSTGAAGVAGASDSGPGVRGISETGLGASLQGGSAAVRLVPQPKAGHPASGRHLRGELLVDSSGKLWLCTKAGTPGTWRQLAFV